MSGRAVTTLELRRVAELYAAGARDTAIAAELGRSPSTVHRARKRLGLIPLYGPGRPTGKESQSGNRLDLGDVDSLKASQSDDGIVQRSDGLSSRRVEAPRFAQGHSRSSDVAGDVVSELTIRGVGHAADATGGVAE